MQWEKRNISRLVGIATVVAVIAGCTGGFKPFKRQDHFPKQEELQKIDERPAPARVFEQMDQVRLAQWQLTGPFPDMIGAVPRQPVDDLDQLAAREAAAIGGVATEAMRCVARETGKIYLAYGKRPELALRRFIQHRCGSTSGTISTAWVSWEEGDLDWAEADKDDAASGSLREEIAAAGTSFENAEVGAWYGASGGRAVAMIAVGRRLIELEPTATTGLKNGTFDLRGSVLDPAAEVVSGVVNHGLYEWERCHALPAKLPRFHLRCHAEPNDVEAGFDVVTAFDAVHDQAHPAMVLSNIRRALRPDVAPPVDEVRLPLLERALQRAVFAEVDVVGDLLAVVDGGHGTLRGLLPYCSLSRWRERAGVRACLFDFWIR